MEEQFRLIDERVIDYLDENDGWRNRRRMQQVFYTKTCNTPQEAYEAAFKRLKRDIRKYEDWHMTINTFFEEYENLVIATIVTEDT
ncbi:MAG TPA: hypothetical protein VJL83_03020 [Patescibacteria group bacterium]|nr:hypothetical protein [Patescibacteria group bacterium]